MRRTGAAERMARSVSAPRERCSRSRVAGAGAALAAVLLIMLLVAPDAQAPVAAGTTGTAPEPLAPSRLPTPAVVAVVPSVQPHVRAASSSPPPPPLPPSPTSPAPALAALRARLQAEVARARSRFSDAAMLSSHVFGSGLSRALGASLTAAALSGGAFVVGVTGGSSTAGRSSWPARLQTWLRSEAVGVTGALVRNAGQGTTSQLVTAPCIRALVGDGVDLLLWEFAMNDEYEYIRDDVGPDYPMRRRVAEAYIRQAAQLGPGALGFVHLWDLDIHSYAGGPDLPNKPFAPTNAVAAAYAPVFDRYFAVDVIGAMWTSQLYADKSTFLRDPHHPNDFGYDALIDLLAIAIAEPWLAYLAAGGDGSDAGGGGGNAAAATASAVRAHPMLTSARKGLFLPGERTLAHCYMAMPPQFSVVADGLLRPVHGAACAAADPRDCDATVNTGRSDADRDDRQLRFTVSACADGGAAGGMLFTADVRHIAAVLIDCGYGAYTSCLDALDVYLDGAVIAPSPHAQSDIIDAFFAWAHSVEALADAPTHSLRICARGTEAQFSRLVVLEQF